MSNCNCFNTIPVNKYTHTVTIDGVTLAIPLKKTRVCKLCSQPLFTADQCDEIDRVIKDAGLFKPRKKREK
jgi:hypothetical protein